MIWIFIKRYIYIYIWMVSLHHITCSKTRLLFNTVHPRFPAKRWIPLPWSSSCPRAPIRSLMSSPLLTRHLGLEVASCWDFRSFVSNHQLILDLSVFCFKSSSGCNRQFIFFHIIYSYIMNHYIFKYFSDYIIYPNRIYVWYSYIHAFKVDWLMVEIYMDPMGSLVVSNRGLACWNVSSPSLWVRDKDPRHGVTESDLFPDFLGEIFGGFRCFFKCWITVFPLILLGESTFYSRCCL